jgi:hypothetical protein
MPGQGVGAWSWVSRKGARRVMDRDLAGFFSGFTWSSISSGHLCTLCMRPELTDWGIPYSGSQFSVGFALSLWRLAGISGLVIEGAGAAAAGTR